MTDFRETHLWRSAFEERNEAPEPAERRAALKRAYLAMREHAALLANEIGRDMPTKLTVHDVSHLDALWELASDVGGAEVELTPAEGFVLGGAILIHDLGLGIAAYPEGRAALECGADWTDALASVVRDALGRFPTALELEQATAAQRDEALELLLRRRHAEHAARLGLTWWSLDGEERMHLIAEHALRDAYGTSIGRVAASHWWSIERVRTDLDTRLNPLPDYPAAWTADLLKLACLLRLADAIHIDSRRAPRFLMALRRPDRVAALHWTFQSKLLRPVVKGDRVRFASGSIFGRAEASAWWLGLDLVQQADRELRLVDDLLADLDRTRFAARGVLGADAPAVFARHVRTEGWTPVAATLKVGDVAGLIDRMGGAQLYGDRPDVPLRELLQNAADAIRARRIVEDRAARWGEVRVELGGPVDDRFVDVRDVGVGMSPRTLSTTLLDFGRSTWSSSDVIVEHPGLAGKGFQSTGRFGIGFFSVLMWGDGVRVTTRRMQDGTNETTVLELLDGASSRPLLRPADPAERLIEAGTAVRVAVTRVKPPAHRAQQRIFTPPVPLATVLLTGAAPEAQDLANLCSALAPTASVSINACVDGVTLGAVEADDWMTLEPDALLKRCARRPDGRRTYAGFSDKHRLRELRNADHQLVGRALLTDTGTGIVTVGGFRAADVPVIDGVLLGGHPNLARNHATPLVERDAFLAWLAEQGELLARQQAEPWHIRVAATLLAYDLPLPDLPLCQDDSGLPLRQSEIVEWAEEEDVVPVLAGDELEGWLINNGFQEGRVDEISIDRSFLSWGDQRPIDFSAYSLPAPTGDPQVESLVEQAVAKAWKLPGPLSALRDEITIGTFDDNDEDVEVLPERIYRRDNG